MLLHFYFVALRYYRILSFEDQNNITSNNHFGTIPYVMKYTLIFLIFILLKVNGNGQGLSRQFLIYEKDTVELTYSFPLGQYFEKIGNREVPGEWVETVQDSITTISHNTYSCLWVLKNDSLFLNRIILRNNNSSEQDVDLRMMFGNETEIVFADWYSGVLTIPRGKYINNPDMGGFGIHESTEKITISKGKFIENKLYSNMEFIPIKLPYD